MPTPWSVYDGPSTFAGPNWRFALMLGNDRAQSHHLKQKITWNTTSKGWDVSDVR